MQGTRGGLPKKKIGVALSGGVDSTAAALLLQQEHEVYGFFMRLGESSVPDGAIQEQKARTVAQRLGLSLEVIDLRAAFDELVLRYFTRSYQQGHTPNPCMVCNQAIKFGLFMENILARGMEAMATGHYARVAQRGDIWHLAQGRDPVKDQSYFLARLRQEQLRRCLFPLGEMEKALVYRLVESHGLTGFRGQESQDVCFLAATTVGQFLTERIPRAEQSGAIVSRDGQKLGLHQGIFHYTIGQRRGLGIADATPWFVIGLDPVTRNVIVGKEEELVRDHLVITNPHWLTAQPPEADREYQVKIRYRHQGAPASMKKINDQRWQIQFATPQRAITPGQFAVIYDQEWVVGCGEIV